MKISEYIEKLQKLQEEYGNVEVVIGDRKYYSLVYGTPPAPRIVDHTINPKVRID